MVRVVALRVPSSSGAQFGAHRERNPDRQHLGGQLVLVDESAEEITTADRSGAAGQARQSGRREVEAAMWSSPVVVRDVLGKDSLEVTPWRPRAGSQAIFTDGAHPPLGERVRVSGHAPR